MRPPHDQTRHSHHPSRPRHGTSDARTCSSFVRVGHNDVYDWTNPADRAEYHRVLSYPDR